MVTIPTASGKRDYPRGCRLTTLGVSRLDPDDCSSQAMCLIGAIFTGFCRTAGRAQAAMLRGRRA